jgi:hypothetical protein
MADATTAHDGRARHWLVDAAVGGGLALGLISAAHAALPEVESAPLASRAVVQASPAIVRAPEAAPVLIAFRNPLPGYSVGSPFGLRQLPWEEQGRLHAGVDIAAPSGEPILAAADGVVVRIATDPGYGRFVEVRHAEGLTTRYGHMSAFAPNLAPGASVKAGETLGQIGSTGTSTGSHLHFEVRDARDRPMNPELFIDRQFAVAADLPLKQALRTPRLVRVAYVSNIPEAKREQMEAKQAEIAEVAAASAADAGVDTAVTVASDGRPHARYR